MAEISKITLPSGNTYDIKDATARQMISGGVSFIIAWDGASTPVVANIPAGVTVIYNDTAYTGTLSADGAQAGAFYLVKSSSQAKLDVSYTNLTTVTVTQSTFASKTGYQTDTTFNFTYDGTNWKLDGNNVTLSQYGIAITGTPTSSSTITVKSPSSYNDVYDEYVPVGTTGSKTWEKIGDTLVDLSDVVTEVTLNKQTSSVVTGYASPTTANVIGADATFTVTQPTIVVTPTTTNVKATASSANTAWNSKDSKTVVTGYAAPSTDTFVKSVSAETNKKLVVTSITPTNGTETVSKVTKTASKLVTTSIPNVTGNTSVTIPNVTSNVDRDLSFELGTGADSETLIISILTNGSKDTSSNTYNGSDTTLGTALTATNTTLGTAITAATGSVDANGTGSDIVTAVTVSDKTVAKQGSSVTVATGATAADGTGDSIVTGVTVGESASAITGLGTPSTANVIGASSTFTITQPTIELETGATAGTGVISVATGINSATASDGNVAWNSKDSKAAITALGIPSTVSALNNSTSITVSKGNQ